MAPWAENKMGTVRGASSVGVRLCQLSCATENDRVIIKAKVEVTPEGQKQLKEYGFELVAGMPAEVMIKTGTRTTLSYLVKPFTDMLSRGFNEE